MDQKRFPFVSNEDEIAKSILSFNSNPDLYREIVCNNPKYFPFYRQGGKIYFALSKFAAFKNVTPEDYINSEGHRYQTRGNVTRKEIEKVTGKEFQSVENFDLNVQEVFKNWITNIYEGFESHSFLLMEINSSSFIKIEKKISPEELAKKLLKQSEIGKVGEDIALQYETERLLKLGCILNKKSLQHTSKINAAAGYDIYSNHKQERFIEVKASTTKTDTFFITENELAILKAKRDRAYLYKIFITDLKKREGVVVEIPNPYAWIKKEMKLTSKLYQVSKL